MICQKHLFSLRPGIHYLNCARKSPLLKTAEEACIKALIRGRNPINISIEDFFSESNVVREYFSKIINCQPSEIAILPSTSYGFSSALNNISPKRNGNAITIKEEFPSGYFSIKRWCKDHQNELVVVGPDQNSNTYGESWNNNIVNAINQNTSIVLMSGIHWMNGTKFDLKRIGDKCKSVGARFILDGTQTVGALPLDVKDLNIDALVCATYKWLFGPYSICLAYFGEAFANGIPLEEAWLNRTNSRKFSDLTNYQSEYHVNAGRYNVGESSNFITMPILRESLKQLNEWDVAKIQDYCKNLIQPLIKYLKSMNVELEGDKYFSNHLFSLKLPGNIDTNILNAKLEQHNIIVSLRGEFIRVSVNVFNDESDIQKLIEVIEMVR